MKDIHTTSRFLRDFKLAKKRGKDMRRLEVVIEILAQGGKLAPRHRPHRLKGDMEGFWECHIEPDWLLIWDEDGASITLMRCGSHADLFD